MLQTLARKIFGSRNDRLVKQYRQRVAAINAHEPKLEKLTDTELSAKTVEFKERRQAAARSLRRGARSQPPRARHAPL